MMNITPNEIRVIPNTCSKVIIASKNMNESKVVIGEPSNSMQVAVVSFTCFKPLYQVKT